MRCISVTLLLENDHVDGIRLFRYVMGGCFLEVF